MKSQPLVACVRACVRVRVRAHVHGRMRVCMRAYVVACEFESERTRTDSETGGSELGEGANPSR